MYQPQHTRNKLTDRYEQGGVDIYEVCGAVAQHHHGRPHDGRVDVVAGRRVVAGVAAGDAIGTAHLAQHLAEGFDLADRSRVKTDRASRS